MNFTFIEMFSGIGGFRLGLERSGWKCIWANDNNKYVNKIYRIQFGYGELIDGDIRKIKTEEIPEHTLLTAGFPCPSFSLAGEKKGFEDPRGRLFFEICRVIKDKNPLLLLLENVKGILYNKKGETFRVVLSNLEELGYDVEWQVLNSKYFGVPQTRERVFIIGYLRGRCTRKIFPIKESYDTILKQNKEQQEYRRDRKGIGIEVSYRVGVRKKDMASCLDTKYSKGLPALGQPRMGVLESKAYSVHNIYGGFKEEEPRITEELAPTIRTPKGGGHLPHVMILGNNPHVGKLVGDRDKPSISIKKEAFCLSSNPMSDRRQMIISEDMLRIRKFTPVECERLQGFPDGWTRWLSDHQRYIALGNAVTVNVTEYLGKKLKEVM